MSIQITTPRKAKIISKIGFGLLCALGLILMMGVGSQVQASETGNAINTVSPNFTLKSEQ